MGCIGGDKLKVIPWNS